MVSSRLQATARSSLSHPLAISYEKILVVGEGWGEGERLQPTPQTQTQSYQNGLPAHRHY